MISVQEARDIIKETVPGASVRNFLLKDAGLLVLATDLTAPHNIPAFRQSSVDGYAFCYEDRSQILKLDGQSQAGPAALAIHANHTATRIYTGAPVPDGADTIVMQEKITLTGDQLIIEDKDIKQGDNLRPIGSEICAGEKAMNAGTLLIPAALGFLSGIGIAEVKAFAPPAVTLVLTGNEIRQPGESLAHGEVFDANSVMVVTALQQAGITNISLLWAADSAKETETVIRTALAQSDLVLVTGGVSVGDYDFVAAAAKACGVQQHFHRVKQKPGKPLFYGTVDNRIFFGLPGNPSSVLTCFYEYVLPAIEQSMHRAATRKPAVTVAGSVFRKPAGLTHFIKAWYDGHTVVPLHAQESYRLHSYAQANCLIVLPEESTGFEAGDSVTIHILPV